MSRAANAASGAAGAATPGAAGAGPGADYIHGTDPTEQARLSRLNDLVNARSLGALALRGGERVLDLGSGLAQLARGMARQGATVVCIERSREQIAEAKRQAEAAGEADRVEMREGDALAPPLRAEEWGSFDVAHARWILQHLSDPLAATRVLVRAVRPGGRVVVEDDDHPLLRIWPEPPGLSILWDAYMRTYDRLGHDPYVGRRLVSLLHEAGAAPVRADLLWFGACAGERDFDGYALNLIRIFEGAADAIRDAGGLDRATFDAAMESLGTWRQLPDAVMWYGISWAEGRKRGS
jgi:SAM-dependent methyltransferase